MLPTWTKKLQSLIESGKKQSKWKLQLQACCEHCASISVMEACPEPVVNKAACQLRQERLQRLGNWMSTKRNVKICVAGQTRISAFQKSQLSILHSTFQLHPIQHMTCFASTDLGSCSFTVDFFSTPRTIVSFPRTPTAVVPFFTASKAYSTWKRCPSGEKTVMARSYLAIFSCYLPLLFQFLLQTTCQDLWKRPI